MPTDDKVQFNYDAKEWVTYGSEVEVVETVYYLRGDMNSWGITNPMTNNGDGTYSVTMDLAAGTYEYKAAVEDWSYAVPGGANLSLTLEADDTVTFTLDINANSLNYTLGSGTVVEIEYFLRGAMNEWAANDASKMTKQADGTYAITLSLAAGTYEYKAATADWSYAMPGGDNAVLTLDADADVTFVLDVAAGTLTNNAPVVEPTYDYYVAGSAGLCGVEWDPTQNQMYMNWATGLYESKLPVFTPGTWEFKVTTGSWETPAYGNADGSNCSVTVYVTSWVIITFNAETKEIAAEVEEWGVNEMKFQFKADASASDTTVDLRMITYVDSLNFAGVNFYATIDGVTSEPMKCTTVYESIVANGNALTCQDIFGCEGYLVTYTLEDIPAEYYDKVITVYAECFALDGDGWSTNARAIVISDVL